MLGIWECGFQKKNVWLADKIYNRHLDYIGLSTHLVVYLLNWSYARQWYPAFLTVPHKFSSDLYLLWRLVPHGCNIDIIFFWSVLPSSVELMLKLSNGLAEKSNETEQENQRVPTTGCYGQYLYQGLTWVKMYIICQWIETFIIKQIFEF